MNDLMLYGGLALSILFLLSIIFLFDITFDPMDYMEDNSVENDNIEDDLFENEDDYLE